MNENIKCIASIVDEIKECMTDFQYKTIMDNLMAIHKTNNTFSKKKTIGETYLPNINIPENFYFSSSSSND